MARLNQLSRQRPRRLDGSRSNRNLVPTGRLSDITYEKPGPRGATADASLGTRVRHVPLEDVPRAIRDIRQIPPEQIDVPKVGSEHICTTDALRIGSFPPELPLPAKYEQG